MTSFNWKEPDWIVRFETVSTDDELFSITGDTDDKDGSNGEGNEDERYGRCATEVADIYF
ncbi:hypothetical protein [Rubritalea tangerina]|uniref:hypothetical protein n=1 Tax=Rubritalea tangerina TaxID=430798 RepID=UPI00360B33AA